MVRPKTTKFVEIERYKNQRFKAINIRHLLGLTTSSHGYTCASFLPICKGRHWLVRQALTNASSKHGLEKIRSVLVAESQRDKTRMRKLNAEGAETLIALIMALIDDVSLISHFVLSSLTTLAKRANLRTVSLAGNESISRGVRGVQTLADWGFVETEKAKFNPYDKRCEVKSIKLTSKFFELLGISDEKVQKARRQLVGEVYDMVVHDNDQRVVDDEFKIKSDKKKAAEKRMKARREKERNARYEALSSCNEPSLSGRAAA